MITDSVCINTTKKETQMINRTNSHGFAVNTQFLIFYSMLLIGERLSQRKKKKRKRYLTSFSFGR